MTIGGIYSGVIRWFLRLVYVVFAAVLAATAYGVYLAWQILTPAGAQDNKPYVLKPGMSAQEVSEQLQDRGVIRNAFAFRLLLKVTKSGDKLQVGEHILSPSMNAMEVKDELMKTVLLPAIKVTVPEGLTAKEVGARVSAKLKTVPMREFVALTLYPETTFPDKTYLPKGSVEGYLFPNTYEFDAKVTPKEAVNTFLKGFEDTILTLPDVKEKRFPQHLTFHQLMILASLVEAEAGVDQDRPLIAGVYLNRLKKQMRLECDATILYAMGQRKVLSLADLKYESPYNTYLHEGLPPGPICNPGKKSIEASLHPKGDFLFYVRNDVKGDKSHVFGKTFEEHQANIRKYSR